MGSFDKSFVNAKFIDQEGILMKKYLQEFGVIGYLLDSFNDFIINGIGHNFVKRKIQLPNGHLEIVNTIYKAPEELHTPKYCRDNNKNYMLSLYAQFRYIPHDKTAEVYDIVNTDGGRYISIGDIPMMLGARNSHYEKWSKQPEKFLTNGEDPVDPGGYFIVNGTEKLFIIQQKVRINKSLVWHGDERKGKKTLTCRMTCKAPVGTTIVLLKEGKIENIRLRLPFMGKNNGKDRTMNVLNIMEIIGVNIDKYYGHTNKYGSLDTIIETIISMVTSDPDEMNKIYVKLQPTILRKKYTTDKNDIYAYVKTKLSFKDETEKVKKSLDDMNTLLMIITSIYNELFPQIMSYPNKAGLERFSDFDLKIKYNMLASMIGDLVSTMAGVRDIDNRDSWANISLTTASGGIEQLFSNCWTTFTSAVEAKLQSTVSPSQINVSAISETAREHITEMFVKSFHSPEWGAKNSIPKHNITDGVSTISIPAKLEHLKRVNVPTDRKAKIGSIRAVQPSQYRSIGPDNTPEGGNSGLLKHLASMATISIARDELTIFNHLKKLLSMEKTGDKDVKFVLNGKMLGWCNGITVRTEAINYKRTHSAYMDISVVIDTNTLFIYTDAGRPTAPLLICDNSDPKNIKLLIDSTKSRDLSFKDLMAKKCIEFIDPHELEFIKLIDKKEHIEFKKLEIKGLERDVSEITKAMKHATKNGKATLRKEKTENGKTIISELEYTQEQLNAEMKHVKSALNRLNSERPPTHCEIDSTAMGSTTFCIIPFPEHNPGPRITFQDSMAKQALGTPHANLDRRWDTSVKSLENTQRPICEPSVNEIIGLDKEPTGLNLLIAIMSKDGYNQEDAIIANRNTVDRVLKYAKMVPKRFTIKTNEVIRYPESIVDNVQELYANLDINGIAKVGSLMKPGQILLAKYKKSDPKDSKTCERNCEKIKPGEEGIIVRIFISKSVNSYETIKFLIRSPRNSIVGDKFAPRMSQKATIGKIYDVCDMPYIVGGPDDGVSPDFIISPISLPSRMTVSLLYEILVSQASGQLGQLYNATGFRNRDIPEMEEMLEMVGFTPSGKVNMIDGSSGKLLAQPVAIGYVSYQMLKHNVKDKIQSRSKGSVDPMHRQPIGGRAQGGALRVGEMERDSFISHGASAILVDRLCTVSDAVKVFICTQCGTIAVENFVTKELTCRVCPTLYPGKKPKFSTTTIPYVYKYLTQLMWGVCIFMQLKS